MRPSYHACCEGSVWAPGKVAVTTAPRLALACVPAPSRAPILNGLWPPRAPAPRGWGGREGEEGCGARPPAPQEPGLGNHLVPLSPDSSALAAGTSQLKQTHRCQGITHLVLPSLTPGPAPAPPDSPG